MPGPRCRRLGGRVALRGLPAILLTALLATPIVLGQRPLPEPARLRRHLDELVARDELDRGFEGERPRRRQPERLVVGVGPDVRQLLLLGPVYVHVGRPA